MLTRFLKMLIFMRLRDQMSKLTLLESPLSIAGHKAGKSESLNNGFSDYYRLRELAARTKMRTKASTVVLLWFCFGLPFVS